MMTRTDDCSITSETGYVLHTKQITPEDKYTSECYTHTILYLDLVPCSYN